MLLSNDQREEYIQELKHMLIPGENSYEYVEERGANIFLKLINDDILKSIKEKTYQKNIKLISAFPGTGKSYYCKDKNDNILICDSDSSGFDKKDFPNNYINHIKEKLDLGYEKIFISSHKDVRKALVENELKFVLIYPSRDLKEEYISRYKERGNNKYFIELLSDNWDNWIDECEKQEGCYHIVLEKNQYISDVI